MHCAAACAAASRTSRTGTRAQASDPSADNGVRDRRVRGPDEGCGVCQVHRHGGAALHAGMDGRGDRGGRGAYTAVGHYDHRKRVSMVVVLSARTGAPVSGPVNTFGEYLFGRVHKGFPQLFAGVKMRSRCCPASTRKYAGSIRMPAAFRHRRRRREYP
ncbi:hypothetical protein METUNv1_02864 [Methyloversatilis universalis FAM5]|uniref:Uncharacterized protein n=1 Tax=Methyloversatilis universalis (strain ATCC BAA-1314 / DSM 25237 / JCM 13912 / CCUG 52030 / FAM5) TaxID=1000565 RepID=F5REY9_METUF|nr:hypothetical protein METUNv1_02864 [Methyloversatilis universalis FAM5]